MSDRLKNIWSDRSASIWNDIPGREPKAEHGSIGAFDIDALNRCQWCGKAVIFQEWSSAYGVKQVGMICQLAYELPHTTTVAVVFHDLQPSAFDDVKNPTQDEIEREGWNLKTVVLLTNGLKSETEVYDNVTVDYWSRGIIEWTMSNHMESKDCDRSDRFGRGIASEIHPRFGI